MNKTLNAEEILETLAQLRMSVPGIDDVPRDPDRSEGRSMLTDAIPAETEEDFEYAAVIEGLQSLADDVNAAVERMHACALETALKIYYAAEVLARDPANAELIPYVEEMRSTYERQYGRPIPEREEGE